METHPYCAHTQLSTKHIINLVKKKQLNQSGIEPEAMKTVNSAGNATEDYSWVCEFHEPFFD